MASFEERLARVVTVAVRQFLSDSSSVSSDPSSSDRHCRTCRCFSTHVAEVRPYRPDTPPDMPRIVLPEGHHEPLQGNEGNFEELLELIEDNDQIEHDPVDNGQNQQPSGDDEVSENGYRPNGRVNLASPEGRWLVEAQNEPVVLSSEDESMTQDWSNDEQNRREWNEHIERLSNRTGSSILNPLPPPGSPPREYSRPDSANSPRSDYSPPPQRSEPTIPTNGLATPTDRRSRLRLTRARRRVYRFADTSEEDEIEDRIRRPRSGRPRLEERPEGGANTSRRPWQPRTHPDGAGSSGWGDSATERSTTRQRQSNDGASTSRSSNGPTER